MYFSCWLVNPSWLVTSLPHVTHDDDRPKPKHNPFYNSNLHFVTESCDSYNALYFVAAKCSPIYVHLKLCFIFRTPIILSTIPSRFKDHNIGKFVSASDFSAVLLRGEDYKWNTSWGIQIEAFAKRILPGIRSEKRHSVSGGNSTMCADNKPDIYKGIRESILNHLQTTWSIKKSSGILTVSTQRVVYYARARRVL